VDILHRILSVYDMTIGIQCYNTIFSTYVKAFRNFKRKIVVLWVLNGCLHKTKKIIKDKIKPFFYL